ncbi:MAG: protease modulator HflC [Proteobacteria bacterium]|nr:protease modulator HflC [Pseudomonadota bacterium]MBU4298036.1 protease modulator HflC [Pseudomonadota bacterium]MCG2749457.1 protease modulator HflC [Desulfobulbaceae bacterium]
MNQFVRYILIAVVVAGGVTVWDGFFIVPEGSQAVVTQFGAPVGQPVTEAGLHFKTPFIQSVRYFDKRILIWDGDPNQIPTKDKTFVYIDATARWRISDALRFLQAVDNVPRAMTLLDDIVDSSIRDLVNKNNLVEIIRSSDWEPGQFDAGVAEEAKAEPIKLGRDKISQMIFEAASKLTVDYGIELVDVMLKRVNYIDTVREKVYERMISERKRIAAEKRSLGEGQKAEILGKVERELKLITSGATRTAEEIKGKADAEAAGIYAAAYNRDPEFYAFSKSLETYRNTFGPNTRMILSTDSAFYKYLNTVK